MTVLSEIIPFPYQYDCLGALRLARESGRKAALAIMASGLGKTIMAALDIRAHLNTNKESRCLFLCHQNDILEQAQGEFIKVLGSKVRCGFFHGFEKTADAQVVFASFQTMRNNLDQFSPGEFDRIVVDETHHVLAETFERVVRYFTPSFLLGITATPGRGDGKDIRDIYGEEVYNLSLVDALARGLLCPVEYKLMTDEINSREVFDTPQGQMSIGLLNRTIFVPKRDEEIASIISRHMGEVQNPKVIVYCSTVKHCEHMAKAIPGAVPIHSKLSRNDRRTRLELFRQGVFQVAVTVDMFNEALDIPQANIIVFLRSTDSPTIFLQQLGRGLRPHEDKEKVVVLDFVGNCERISVVYDLWQEVRSQRAFVRKTPEFGQNEENGESQIEPFNLSVDTVEFKERVLPLLELIGRLRAEFYPTWEEASEAAKLLGCKTAREYWKAYRDNPKLPSKPHNVYEDFPGYDVFLRGGLGKSRKRYSTWILAASAARKLDIKTCKEYSVRYQEDPMLPSAPEQVYKDFPDWPEFLSGRTRDYYLTWQEASAAAIRLGVKNMDQSYRMLWRKDPRLHPDPSKHYADFPGSYVFLGKKKKVHYADWKSASQAAISMGICSASHYRKGYEGDDSLPADPSAYYKNKGWPGWDKFLGKV
ncbi:MAG: DEAD/DEAH box helicase family protein [Candidatus Paceibacterota bacterium]|jgi:superfamily II DNA or RNA helicase